MPLSSDLGKELRALILRMLDIYVGQVKIEIEILYATVGVFSECMETCMCLRGTSTPSITIRTNINAAISRSEIESVLFEFFCVISDALTSGIHYCLHTMG